ncbi:hypothetical protein [Bartonella raoultii]|uniref:hypothetical protein n=1 Tax=Bartonella raoultii TaxID=1457020 RepID=UPI001ABBB669|nr:hypothetical protein [Bartonella raoultii]
MAWKRIGNGLETAWKRLGNGLETAWKRLGNGLETAWNEKTLKTFNNEEALG